MAEAVQKKPAREATMTRIGQLGALLLLALLAAPVARAETVRLGVMADFDGPYSDINGKWMVEAVRMAIEDTRDRMSGWQVEFITGDPLNKPDVGVAITRRWFDQEGVDAVVGVPNSAVALAVQKLATERERVHLITGAGSSELTGTACSPYAAQWHDDSYMQASAAVRFMTQQGEKDWFFLTVDYAFGRTLEDVATRLLQQSGGRVVGHAAHPFGSQDFSSYLLTARTSGARVIALANAGSDMINTIKQAHEFGMPGPGQVLLPLSVFITDVHSLGLETAQGLVFATGFYWDLNDATRAWSRRFFARAGRMPTKEHAEAYSAVRHYLLAIGALNTKSAAAVMAWMRATPVDDFYAPGGILREDGRLSHDVLLVQVKAPSESKAPWDYYKVLGTIGADQAVQPLAESLCPLVKH